MRPAYRLVALVLLVCLIGSGRAEAGIWDWLEELNGPGPSSTRGNFMMNFSCRRIDEIVKPTTIRVMDGKASTEEESRIRALVEAGDAAALAEPLFTADIKESTTRWTKPGLVQTVAGGDPVSAIKTKTVTTTKREVTWDPVSQGTRTKITESVAQTEMFRTQLPKLKIPKDPGAAAKCWFFDVRALHASGDARFYPVTILFPEVGTSVWLHDLVEVGAGAGGIFFWSRNKETGQEFKGFRPTVTFPRISFRPLLAIPQVSNARWGFFQVYFKESIILFTLDENDFATITGHTFSRHSQRVESMGFILDLTALFNWTK